MHVTRMEGQEVVEEEVETVASLDGLSANAAARLLIMAEAQRIVRAGGLFKPVLGAVRWGWENVPRTFGTTFVRYWGDPFSSDTAPLETAYACARLARKDEGLRIACSHLDFPQACARPLLPLIPPILLPCAWLVCIVPRLPSAAPASGFVPRCLWYLVLLHGTLALYSAFLRCSAVLP